MRNAGPALTRATNSDEIGTLEAIRIYSVLQYIEKSVSEKGVARKILTCDQFFIAINRHVRPNSQIKKPGPLRIGLL